MSAARLSALAFGLGSCMLIRAQFAGPFPIPVAPVEGASFSPELMERYSGYMQCTSTDRSLKLDVNTMAFDANGTLWMGLTNGLLRVDGDRQTLFQSQRKDSTSLPNNTITSLLVDNLDRSWVGTQNGLARYDRNTGCFMRYRIDADSVNAVRANRFWGLYDDGHDRIYCITESGIHTISKRTGTFRTIEFRIDGVDPFDAGHFFQVSCLSADGAALWVASTLGIMRIDLANGSVRPIIADGGLGGATPLHATAICADGPDHLWFVERDDDRIGRLDLRTGARTYWPSPKGGAGGGLCRWLRSAPDHQLWMQTWDDQLFLLDLEGGRATELFPASPHTGPELNTMAVRRMLVDGDGRSWLATSAGAIALLPGDPRVQHWRVPGMTSPRSELTTITRVNDGTTIMGSYRQGVHIRDPRTGAWSSIKRTFAPRGERFVDSENSILCAEPIDEDHLLVGTYHGILLLDMQKRALLDLPRYELANKRLTRAQIMDLQFDQAGRLWVATWKDGLLCYDASADTCYRYLHDPADPSSLPIDRLLCLLFDRQGRLWIGANDGGGICRYDEGANAFIRYPMNGEAGSSPLPGVVRCMTEGDDGNIWIGTHSGGLARLDPGTGAFTSYDRSDGLPGDLARSIVFHPEHGLWVGGSEGLARWSSAQNVFQRPDLGVEWSGEPMAMHVIEEEDRLLVLNGPEAVLIDLETLDEHTTAPTPRLLEVRVNGQVLLRDGASGEIALQQGRDRVSFEFSLQDPIRAQNTRLAWRLRGSNDQWEDCLGCRSLSFGDLPRGDYQLEVRAMRSDGQWDTPVSIATFGVHPPWWNSWWFRIGALLSLVMAAVVGFRLYLRVRLREQRERMEREQAVLSERMRIAGDMHDDMGAGLSALKLRSEMALRMEKDPHKREQLSSLAGTAGELIGSMRQIIWTMNQDQATLEDLVVYTTSYARGYCEQHGLAIEVITSATWPLLLLTTEQRRNVFLVVKEALHNIVKHANAQHVRLEVRCGNELEVLIADDGIGAAPGSEVGEGNGMRNMRKRVEALHGSFRVHDDGGTRVQFSVPLSTSNQGSIAGG